MWQVADKGILPTIASPEFLCGLLKTPSLVRNVSLVGHLHHGKTLIMDMLVEATHLTVKTLNDESERHMRFTDTRLDEQQRMISIKAMPMSLVLENSDGKSYVCNIMDAPGHVNFSDEMTAAMRLSDGVVLVVDAVEGVMVNTERAIKHAFEQRLPICMVINKVRISFFYSPVHAAQELVSCSKSCHIRRPSRVPGSIQSEACWLTKVLAFRKLSYISNPIVIQCSSSPAASRQVDRLITELKLPPSDAYHKLRHTLEDVNALLATHAPPGSDAAAVQLDPVLGES